MPKRFPTQIIQDMGPLTVRPTTGHSSWSPNTDVYETHDRLIVKMELAGIEAENIEVMLHDRLLVVCGCRQDACRPKQHRCSFRQMEIDYGYFERRIVLPQPVDAAQTRARLHNGFLRVELPKAARHTSATLAILIERLA